MPASISVVIVAYNSGPALTRCLDSLEAEGVEVLVVDNGDEAPELGDAAAVLISPLFLLSKKRQHFLTVGYSDDENRQQAMIFKVGKDDIRATLVSLEARTGRRIEYQDAEARKAGKG